MRFEAQLGGTGDGLEGRRMRIRRRRRGYRGVVCVYRENLERNLRLKEGHEYELIYYNRKYILKPEKF